jgi:uncharacterized protein (DUF433 family)
MGTRTATAHVWLDERGRAWLDDTNVKVVEVVLDMLTGMTPEEMYEEHYHNPSLAQIHAALSYYYDHKAEFDAEIERQVREVDALRAASLESPIREKLRAMGKIP